MRKVYLLLNRKSTKEQIEDLNRYFWEDIDRIKGIKHVRFEAEYY
jgi:hypothetical protein